MSCLPHTEGDPKDKAPLLSDLFLSMSFLSWKSCSCECKLPALPFSLQYKDNARANITYVTTMPPFSFPDLARLSIGKS